MALISLDDWLDRFGDAAEDGPDVDLASLRFKAEPAAPSRPFTDVPRPGWQRIDQPLLGYRAGPPFVERRAAPRFSR